MRNRAYRFGILGSVLIGTLAWGSNSSASGFSTARFGAEHGTPVSTNPTAIYYNPAGIALSESPYNLYLDVSVAMRSASFQHSQIHPCNPDDPNAKEYCEPPGAQGANTDQGKLFNVLAIPMFGASARFGNFAVGAGVYVPFGGTSIWDKNERFKNNPTYPGPYDGPARWYSINGTIQSTYYTLGAAYHIPRTGLTLGVSGNLVQSVIHTIRARISDGSNDVAAEGRSYTDTKGWNGSFGVGAMYELLKDKVWVGASYQSKPGVTGGIKLKGTLRGYFNGVESLDRIQIEEDLPDIIRAGVRYRVKPSIELRLFGDYTRWSALKQMCMSKEGESCVVQADGSRPPGNTATIQNLPRNWNDAWGIRFGTSIWPIEPLEVMIGTGYDSNAIPDKALDPALMDFHKVMLALGGRYRFVKQVFGALTVSQFFYVPRDTNGDNINATWKPPSAGPDAGGKYTQRTTVINANVQFAF
ncbi:MAG: outer membrane protein transport protein [Deltaproteobacteria bacterium]|nr:outer membrane protein transport protein [Deltaproteobacteria bacterium]